MTYHRWRQEYGGRSVSQAKRLKEPERENARLRRAVADPTLDRMIPQEAARGNRPAPGAAGPRPAGPSRRSACPRGGPAGSPAGTARCSATRPGRDRETKRVWLGEASRRLPRDIQGTARRKLRLRHVARTLDDLRVPPGNRLEPLKHDRRGQWSIRINDRWRICFSWEQGDAYWVEIVDYHRG